MWKPVLDGAVADAARATALDITRALATGAFPISPMNATLFWAYAAGAFDEPWVAEAYDAAVDQLAGSAPYGLALYGGVAGMGFAIAHVGEPEAVAEPLAAIDALVDKALVEPWRETYDLIGGLVGIGVYLLERGRSLERVVDHLVARCERTSAGATWFTPPELLAEHPRSLTPAGRHDCGLAHGVPGVVALLGRIAALPDGDPRARPLALDTLAWLAAQQLPGDAGRYPSWSESRGPARTAWCYGDPGVAIAMFGAARRLGVSDGDALALAAECAARPFERTGIMDAGLCHGAAGLAHIYARIYNASGDDRFREAARSWFERVLAMRGDSGIAGFLAWTSLGGEQPSWQPTTSLLEGATGIALALLAASSTTEPLWDRTLLCDL